MSADRFSQPTIRKSGKRGKWSWEAVVYDRENGGKARTKRLGIDCDPPKEGETAAGSRTTPSGKGSKAALEAAAAWREELIASEATGTSPAGDDGMTVPEFVQAYWQTLDVEPGTLRGYQYEFKHIDCPLLRVPIAELTPTLVEAWKAQLAETTGASMARKSFDQLKWACDWGVRLRLLTANPCDPVKAPRKPNREPTPLDEENLTKLQKAVADLRDDDPLLADCIEFALLTGMREGELCALTWGRVQGKSVDVAEVVARGNSGSYIKPYPKNREQRSIPRNKAIDAVLERRRAAQEAVRDDLDGCYVFARPLDAEQFPSAMYLSKKWSGFIAGRGIKTVGGTKPRFHDLRDTFATHALTNGIDVVTVAAILGHKDTATTLRKYARWLPNKNAEAMEKMGDVLGGEQG